jgi:hypothetical protein
MDVRPADHPGKVALERCLKRVGLRAALFFVARVAFH